MKMYTEFELTNIDQLIEALKISNNFLTLMQENITSLQASLDAAKSVDVKLKIKIPNS